ncbi:hypothetical protein CEK26_009221 [Fusarium fujikuroi]|nr:hypothetical protein CEK27_009241 [Fusarium fujikuroi]QGI82519.1 hypothetical protein CEK25_009248 [Fusarium fujikuroi]QGI96152.1 hypothetical protein CEK26_009221 [Fusarium fujikuroi]
MARYYKGFLKTKQLKIIYRFLPHKALEETLNDLNGDNRKDRYGTGSDRSDNKEDIRGHP